MKKKSIKKNHLQRDENGRIIINKRPTEIDLHPSKDEEGYFIVDKRNNELINQSNKTNDCLGTVKSLGISLSDDKEKVSKKNKKDKHNKKNKRHKKHQNNYSDTILIDNLPFHQDETANSIIEERFRKIKFNNVLANDTNVVDIWMHLYDTYIKYATDIEKWIYWTGKRWKIDNDYITYNYAAKTVYEINKLIKYSDADKSDKKNNMGFGNNRSIKNILEMGKSRCVCHSEDFDKKPHLITLRNGTMNLKNLKLREHRPEDMITQLIDIDYNPAAESHRFYDFILEISDDDKNLAEYIQVLYGYALTGETSEQHIFLERGSGSNGKSLLRNTIETIAEEYTERVDFALFQNSKYASPNSPSPELAKLRGKRIVFCSETDNSQFNEAKIKEITGGTKITARALYGHPFTYTPQFTIIFDGNNMPTINGVDHGIWRRIVVIPFNRRFEVDTTLQDTLLKEKEVILRWLIDGAYIYYNNGFPDCKAVNKATNEYRYEEDTVEAFLRHMIKDDPGNKCYANALYEAYDQYCRNYGSSPVNIKIFKSALTMKGYKNKRRSSGIVWLDIRLKENKDEYERI